MTPEERAAQVVKQIDDSLDASFMFDETKSLPIIAAAIREAVEEERRNTGWQLIDIAPRDKKILAWNGKEYTVAWFGAVDTLSDAYVGWMDSESRELDTFLDPEPTHWMALPEPPLER